MHLAEYPYSGAPVVSLLGVASLDDRLLAQWHALCGRLLEENIYLAPGFAMPAISHLAPAGDVLALTVHAPEDEQLLLGLGLFVEKRGSFRYPFRMLSAFKSPHSFLTGMLVDKDRHQEVVEAVRHFMHRNRYRWSGIEFRDLEWDGHFARLMRGPAALRANWHSFDIEPRACIDFDQQREPDASIRANRKFFKNLQRSKRNLQQAGNLGWRIVAGEQITDEVLDTFLRLENAGWKGESGTSFRSRKDHSLFFDGVMRALREKNAFFTELLLDDKVIASTCNLYSHRTAFAFKIAWDPDYAKYSPGMLNEYEFLVTPTQMRDRLEHIDSGASTGSYIEKLWPDRKPLASGVFIFNPFARRYAQLVSILRALRHRARRLWRKLKGAT